MSANAYCIGVAVLGGLVFALVVCAGLLRSRRLSREWKRFAMDPVRPLRPQMSRRALGRRTDCR